jgi:hypothetical protein
MKQPNEPDQGSLGLGKKVEEEHYRPQPKDDWQYIGGFHWKNGKGQRSFNPPTPESPAEQWWRVMGQAVKKTDQAWPFPMPDATLPYIDPEWYL